MSLDGDAEATGQHRRFANGRNSFDAIADGLRLLGLAEFRACYSGLLCTIDTRNDPIATYEALLKFTPPALDLLLPHANWSSPPPGVGYADWLISVFDRWYDAPRQETQIRLFRELIQLVLGQPGAVEGLGLLPSTLVVIDTDGSVKQLDSLSSAYPGAADTGLHARRAASMTRSITQRRSRDNWAPRRCLRSAWAVRSWRSAAAACTRTATGTGLGSVTPPCTVRTCWISLATSGTASSQT